MDSLFGLKGKDFVVVVAETTVNHSIFKLKTRHEKTISFNDRCVASFSGDHADRCNFGAYVRQNIAFSRFKNGRELTIDEIANFTRTNLAEALRKQPYQVNTLIDRLDSGSSNGMVQVTGSTTGTASAVALHRLSSAAGAHGLVVENARWVSVSNLVFRNGNAGILITNSHDMALSVHSQNNASWRPPARNSRQRKTRFKGCGRRSSPAPGRPARPGSRNGSPAPAWSRFRPSDPAAIAPPPGRCAYPGCRSVHRQRAGPGD